MHQGRKAKELREARGWIQEELRRRLRKVAGREMSRPAISLLESREWLEGELIADLARVFGVSAGVFFDTPPPPQETREEVIDRAFEYVRRDPTVDMPWARIRQWPTDAKLAIVRLYEKYTEKRLLPDDIL